MVDRNFFILQANKTRRLTSFLRGSWARLMIAAMTILIFLGLAIGVFLFSFSSFSFLGQYPDSAQPIITYVLAATLILTSVLVFGSSLIAGLSILFQKKDNLLLFSLPIKTEAVFESRLLETIVFSSWPLLVFALPQILGFSLALKLAAQATFLFLVGLLFLNLFFSLLGALAALVVTRFWGNLKSGAGLFLVLIAPLLAWGLIKIVLPPELTTNLEDLTVVEISQLVQKQTLMSSWLPSTWLVNLITNWQPNSQVAASNLTLLSGGLIGVLILLQILKGKFYLQAVNQSAIGRFIAGPWDKVKPSGLKALRLFATSLLYSCLRQERRSSLASKARSFTRSRVVKKKARSFPYLIPGRMGALTEKDWLMILRSPSQVTQIAFLIFLLVVYLLITARIPLERVQRLFPHWYEYQLAVFNFLFIGYLTSVLAIRFLFPLMSLEGQSSWIIWSAPLRRMKIFWQKLASSFLILLAWLEISTVLAIKSLGLPLAEQWPLFLINLPLGAALTVITVGLGTIKPNFREENPEKLSTTPGGIIATALCLIYVGAVNFFLFLPGFLHNPTTQLIVWSSSALLAGPIIFLVSQKINRYEV